MGILEGKRILVTGILNDDSLAFGVAKLAQEEGAEVVATSFGRVMSLTKRVVRKLPTEVDVLELDVNKPEDVAASYYRSLMLNYEQIGTYLQLYDEQAPGGEDYSLAVTYPEPIDPKLVVHAI